MKFRFSLLPLLFSLFCPQPTLAEASNEVFLAAMEAAQTGARDRLESLSSELQGHELAAYADYWRLQMDMKNGIDPATIRDFLTRHEGHYIAEKMRSDWLRQVGRQRKWDIFDAEYPALAQPTDRELFCYALQSRLARCDTPDKDTASPSCATVLDEALPLWLTLLDPPESCYPVFEALIVNKRIQVDETWARIRRQLESGRLTGARHSMNYLPKDQKPDAKTVLSITEKPQPWLVRTRPSKNRLYRELAALALANLARNDPLVAAKQLQRLETHLSTDEKAWVWSVIGWYGAMRHMGEASVWFGKAGEMPMSSEAAQWRVRAALRAQDWNGVRMSIGKLPPSLAEEPVWVYWLGRAERADGRTEEADALFARIAHRTDFYGNLAREELGQRLDLPPRAEAPSISELARIAGNRSIRRALVLFRLNQRPEGLREWNWALRGMNDRELLAVAAIAEWVGIHDRAISAAERTRGEHDYARRYPSPYSDWIRPAARERLLDEAWVYGLIRQESRFFSDAYSSAGALGLMQVMPTTARWVANKIGLKDFHPSQVNNPEINVLLGTSYMRSIMDRFEHPVLVSAGYNAGPGRARKWQSERSLEGAIYAETIPFNETRDYVKRVMNNAIYYSALFNEPRSLREWLGTIGPRGTGQGEGFLP